MEVSKLKEKASQIVSQLKEVRQQIWDSEPKVGTVRLAGVKPTKAGNGVMATFVGEKNTPFSVFVSSELSNLLSTGQEYDLTIHTSSTTGNTSLGVRLDNDRHIAKYASISNLIE